MNSLFKLEGETIGGRLKTARNAAGLTQVDLAVKTGLSHSHIGGMETDKVDHRVGEIATVAKALNVDRDWILLGKEVATPCLQSGAVKFEIGEREVNLLVSGLEHLTEAAETALENGMGLMTAKDRYDIAKERDGARLIAAWLTGQGQLDFG